jgi:hypothetical protein
MELHNVDYASRILILLNMKVLFMPFGADLYVIGAHDFMKEKLRSFLSYE